MVYTGSNLGGMAPWECVPSVQRRKHYARFCSTHQPLDRTGEEASQSDFHPRKCKTRTEVSSPQAFRNQPHRHMWPTLPLNIISTAFKGWLSGLSTSLPTLLMSPSVIFLLLYTTRIVYTWIYFGLLPAHFSSREKRHLFILFCLRSLSFKIIQFFGNVSRNFSMCKEKCWSF